MKKNKAVALMVDKLKYLVGKPIANKNGFTLIEMLFVLLVVSIILVVTAFPFQEKRDYHSMFWYQLTCLIEETRLEAIHHQEHQSIEFKENEICNQYRCIYHIDVQNPQTVTFNANGHIQRGTHINVILNGQAFQFIFNVGEGAYHVEKNSLGIYFTGFLICVSYLFKCGDCSLFKHYLFIQRFKQQLFRKRHRVARKRAFTLLETLLALMISSLIIFGFSFVLQGINHFKTPNHMDDFISALVLLSEDVNVANEVNVSNNELTLVYSSKTFHFTLDHGRLVKKPGFDIYLYGLDDLSFKEEGKYLYIYLRRGDNDGWFCIGTSYRPQKGVCQPAGNDAFDDIDDDHNGIN